eukprot:gb/GECG01004567.1/.p1 GENE.gb/GECG01004567.1/~~gb/GECG01004567.1/.p1  ORF type:complete len:297 (+),score=28.55 gb/GECG01004567.1/:1-891(+)
MVNARTRPLHHKLGEEFEQLLFTPSPPKDNLNTSLHMKLHSRKQLSRACIPGKKAELPAATRKRLHNRPEQQEANSAEQTNYLKNLPEAAEKSEHTPDPETPEGKLAALVRQWSAMSASEINSVVATKQEELLAYLATTGIQPLISSVPLPKVDPIRTQSRSMAGGGRNTVSTSQLPNGSSMSRTHSRVTSAKSSPAKYHSTTKTISRTKQTASAPLLPRRQTGTAATRKGGVLDDQEPFRQHRGQIWEALSARQHTPALRRHSAARHDSSSPTLPPKSTSRSQGRISTAGMQNPI